jgi:hypothetical protein
MPVRTSSKGEGLEAAAIAGRYKSLSLAENAFRSLKTVDLKVRPIHHRNADRARSHVLLCLLAYYVEWHMRSVLKPALFDDEENPATRPDPVAPKEPSLSAKAKARTKRTPTPSPPIPSKACWTIWPPSPATPSFPPSPHGL